MADEHTPVLPVPYFLARPAHATVRSGAAVVVIQEGNGISPQLLRVCERLAREGYLVAAPDVFHRLGGPNPEEAGRQYTNLSIPDAIADIGEVVAQLRGLGATRVGVTGFCMGGRLTYETATSGIDVQCAVPFYGGGIAGVLGTPTCPTLLLFGGTDEWIPTADIEAVQAHHGDDVVVYPDAGHGFFRDGSESYDAEAAADAWHRLTGMFHAHLG
jgi:carboxymethylenebutenolidase